MNYEIFYHDVLESTNTTAKTLLKEQGAAFQIVRAGRQTAGRGRYGRTWQSPEGNLYFSLIIPPYPRLSHLVFAAAVAMGEAVIELCGQAGGTADSQLPLTYKWPNDLLLDGRKIGGILIEPEDNGIIIGIGVNVRRRPEGETVWPATCLAEKAADAEPGTLLEEFIRQWRRLYALLQAGEEGWPAIKEMWMRRAWCLGQPWQAPGEHYGRIFCGIDDEGNMLTR